LAVASIIVGVTLHAFDGALSGIGLASLADTWGAAPEDDRTALVKNGDLPLRILDGTWTGVITLFHGVPFILAEWLHVEPCQQPSSKATTAVTRCPVRTARRGRRLSHARETNAVWYGVARGSPDAE